MKLFFGSVVLLGAGAANAYVQEGVSMCVCIATQVFLLPCMEREKETALVD